VTPPAALLGQVTLLYSGKLRGRLLPQMEGTGRTCTKEEAVLPGCVGGLPNIAAYARKLVAGGRHVVLVDAGEFFFGGDGFAPEDAGELARLAGYSCLNANARDFQHGIEGFKDFARALGPSVPIVLSNGDSQTLNTDDPSLGRTFVVGFGAVDVSSNFTVGFLGLADGRASLYLKDLYIDRIKDDTVSTMAPNLRALRHRRRPHLIVVMNSLNNDQKVDDIATYLLGSQVVIGGTGTSKSQVSLTEYGSFLNFGWLSSYGGKELQQLDITVNVRGEIVDSQYASIRMSASVANLSPDDLVLSRAYEMFSKQSRDNSDVELGYSNVTFFFEGDSSRCVFSREQAPMMYLVTRVLYDACADCSAVVLHPDLIDDGLRAGSITQEALRKIFPRTGDESIVEVIELTGAQLLEGLKVLVDHLREVPLIRGLRLSILNTGAFAKMTAVMVDIRGGGYANVDRTQMYRIALPRWHRLRNLPWCWAPVRPVKTLGQVSDLLAGFLRMNSPLGLELLRPFGVIESLEDFKINLKICDSRPREELWRTGCAYAVGNYPELPEMLAQCKEGETVKCEDCFEGGTMSNFQCVSCEAGKVRLQSDRSIDGFWTLIWTPSNLARQPFFCSPCPRGTYRNGSMLASQCELCPIDTFAPTDGSKLCQACPDNTNQQDRGQTSCQCDVSYYKNPSDDELLLTTKLCLPCSEVLSGSVTRYPGSRTQLDCLCPSGSYQRLMAELPSERCVPCPAGMDCPAGSVAHASPGPTSTRPTPRRGHMTLQSDPLEAYLCLSDDACPGGDEKTCAEHNDDSTVACGGCDSGSFMGEDGVCAPCDESPENRVVIVVLVLAAALAAVSFIANRELITQSRCGGDASTLLGFGIFAVQIFGTFDGLRFTEVGPIAKVARACRGFTLDVKFLHLECVANIDVVGQYALAQCAPFAGFLFIVFVIILKKCFKRTVYFWCECANTIGTVCQLVFIGVLYNCIRPLVCFGHPGGTHASVRTFPAVLCFESLNHQKMLWIAAASVAVVPLPFLAANVVAVWMYPTFIVRGSGNDFVKAMRFLFIRFRPDAFFYCLVLLVRSLAFCLVPILCRDKPAVQLWATIAILCSFLVVQQTSRPWSSGIMNVIDGMVSVMMVLLALSGSSQDLAAGTEDMELICNATAIMTTCIVLLPLVDALRRMCRQPLMYAFFVCHHKMDAAAQSRLLKMMLDKVSNCPTFIDSDHLKDLGLLFDTVKFKTGQVIVYLTRWTLTRAWCAGEITSAHACNVPVAAIVTESYVQPTPVELANLSSYVDFSNFEAAVYGISESLMTAALTWFCHSSEVDRFLVVMEQSIYTRCQSIVEFSLNHKKHKRASMAQILNVSVGLRIREITSRISRFRSAAAENEDVSGVLISADPFDDEAVAGAYVVKMLIAMKLFISEGALMKVMDDIDCNSTNLKDVISQAHGLIVVLSAGTLRCGAQLRTICEGVASREEFRGLALVPVSTPGFRFVTEDGMDKVLPTEYVADPSKKLQVTKLFKLIACPLGLHDSSSILSAQCDTIWERLKTSGLKVRSSTLQPSGSVSSTPATDVAEIPVLTLEDIKKNIADNKLILEAAEDACKNSEAACKNSEEALKNSEAAFKKSEADFKKSVEVSKADQKLLADARKIRDALLNKLDEMAGEKKDEVAQTTEEAGQGSQSDDNVVFGVSAAQTSIWT